ncbi:glycoside hydrolase family protein [Planctomycetota bacterium]
MLDLRTCVFSVASGFVLLFSYGCNSQNSIERVDDLDIYSRLEALPLESKTALEQITPGKSILIDKGWFIWGASVIKGEDSRYHMFYSRWPHGSRGRSYDPSDRAFDGMQGWLKYSEIAYAVSDNPVGPFRPVKTILKGTGNKDDWDCYSAHGAHIKKFGGEYYLYYSSTNPANTRPDEVQCPLDTVWSRFVAGQRMGVLVADSIENIVNGKFRRFSKTPVLTPDGVNTFGTVNNGTVTKGPEGLYYMIFKSAPPDLSHATTWIGTAKTPTGPFKVKANVFKERQYAVEDPYLWYDKNRDRFYALVKEFGEQKLVSQFGALALLTSKDCLSWALAQHNLAALREAKFADGSKMDLAHIERPQVLFDDNGEPLVIYAAAAVNSPFAVASPVESGRPWHNSFNIHLPITPAKDTVDE